MLDKLGALRWPARRNAACKVCGICAPAVSGLHERIRAFVAAWAGSLLVTARRLYDSPAHLRPRVWLRSAEEASKASSFTDTLHGAGCYRLDRASLFVAGVVGAMYPDDALKEFLFAVIFIRAVANDALVAQMTLRLFEAAFGCQFGLVSFLSDPPRAAALLERAWAQVPDADMGYGARMLPQVFQVVGGKKPKGKIRETGLTFLIKLARRLLTKTCQLPVPDSVDDWEARNTATLKFLTSLGLGDGLFCTVVARDLGCKWPLLFNSSLCFRLGINAKAGLSRLLPALPKFAEQDRFKAVCSVVLSRLASDYESLALSLPEMQPQSVAHQLCDFTQQTGRAVQKRAKQRRSTEDLRLLAKAAFQAQGFESLAAAIPVPAGRRTYTDTEVLDLLATVLQRGHPQGGLWDAEKIDAAMQRLSEPARKRRCS